MASLIANVENGRTEMKGFDQMEIFKKNLLNHPPQPLCHNPEELEHNDLSLHLFNDHHGHPTFALQHSKKDVYAKRAVVNRIHMNAEDLKEAMSAAISTLEKVDREDLLVCQCGRYIPADQDCCESCKNERIRLWKIGGNQMVRAFGFTPLHEKTSQLEDCYGNQ